MAVLYKTIIKNKNENIFFKLKNSNFIFKRIKII